jgi:hypothetical protein
LRADVRDQIRSSFQNLFIKEDIGSPDARYRFTWMGRKAELGHVLEKQKKHEGGCRPLKRYCIECGPTAPVLPELRADVRDQILLVISKPVLSKKILALQMRGTD